MATQSLNESFVGSIDQGTTSSRFLIFNEIGEVVASDQQEFTQIYPQPGWVTSHLIFKLEDPSAMADSK